MLLALKLAFIFAVLGSTVVSLSLASEDIPALVKQAMPSVVLIKTYDSQGNELGLGSGFIISKEGDIITCYHVMRGYSKAVVNTSDGREFQVRNITAINKSNDLVRVSLSTTGHNFTNLRLNTTAPQAGQEVIAIGGPLGLENTVSQGIVSAIRENKTQITAPISPGSSGGPVLNMNGEVIGIVSSQMVSGQNLNFAIPARLASTMQQPSTDQLRDLLEPYSEVRSSNMPLWEKWGYLSEEDFIKQHDGKSLSGAYFGECIDRYLSKEKYEETVQCCDYILNLNPSYALAGSVPEML